MKFRCFASCLFLLFGSGFIAAIANVDNQSDPAPCVGTAISGSRIDAKAEGSHVRTYCAVIRSNTVYREETNLIPSLQALSSETHLDVREPDFGASTSAVFEAVIGADVMTMRT